MATGIVKKAVLVVVGVFVLAQAVRPSRTNPPVDPAKTLAATGQVPAEVVASLNRACRDCHSNETVWPWYTNVTPVSWWVAHHVKEGRREVNFSTWADLAPERKAKKLGDICEEVREGEMPMEAYVAVHREAALTDAERQAICSWANAARAGVPQIPPGLLRDHRD